MSILTGFLLALVLIVGDQLIKGWALAVLAYRPEGISLIPGLLRLTYVENYGAAFGMLQGWRIPLTLATGAVLCVVAWVLATGRLKHWLERLCAALILAGGTGNLIDRLTRGFVVDYLDIGEWFSFPVFNLADCCVVVGAVLMAAYTIWRGEPQKAADPTAPR